VVPAAQVDVQVAGGHWFDPDAHQTTLGSASSALK
jgi:hypothetical protein